jgi:hypothetical protein
VHAAPKLLQVCEQVKITWSQVNTAGRMRKKSQAKPAFKNRNTARISQSAGFLIFLFIFKYYKKSQNARISMSFIWLVTKRLLRPVNHEMVQFVDLRK